MLFIQEIYFVSLENIELEEREREREYLQFILKTKIHFIHLINPIACFLFS